MELVVVYKARYEIVSQVIGLLRKEGFNPVVLENPSSVALYASRGTYMTHIAVPRDEAGGAKSVLAKWEKSLQPRVDKVTKKLAADVFYSGVLVVVVAAVFVFFDNFSGDIVPYLLLIWIVSFVLMANAHRLWKK